MTALSSLVLTSMAPYDATSVEGPRQALEAQRCVGTCGDRGSALLTPIAMFRKPNTITTVPRTPGPLGFLRAVGMLEIPNHEHEGHAAAFLLAGVGGCYALTNYHAAFAINPPSAQKFVTISFGQGHENSFEVKISARAVPGAWVELPAGQERQFSDDWVLLRLDTCVGDRFGGFEMADLDGGDIDQLMHMTVSMASYARWNDYRRGITYEADCPYQTTTYSHIVVKPNGEIVRDRRNNELMHYCSSQNFSSGSPLLVNEGGKMKVAAMNCGESILEGDDERKIYNPNDKHRWNSAVPMLAIQDRIKSLIAADQARNRPAPN
jgi:hypothetical protein